ncbi:MAG: NAD(P)H-binding protein [Flavobacteriales bacterium]
MSKIVVVLGGTGLIGSTLIELLCQDQNVAEIRVLARRSLQFEDAKIKVFETNLSQPDAAIFENADALYCCIGTTKKKTPNQDAYRQIDHGMTLAAAGAAKHAGVAEVHLISAIGADPQAKIFYNRLKGEIEKDLLALTFERTYIYQPALLIGERPEKRFGEKLAQWISPFLDSLLNQKAMKYHSVKAHELANAMLQHSFQTGRQQQVLHYPDFFEK